MPTLGVQTGKEIAESPGYEFSGPLATITDTGFFRCWMDDEAYFARLTRAPDDAAGDAVAQGKRIAVGFQRDLARMVAGGRIGEEVDALLARYMTDEYRQHDVHLEDGRAPLAAFFKDAEAAGVDLWPPMPVCVLVEGDIVSLLLQAEPIDGVEKFIPTTFRIREGRMAEHWSAATPPAVPPAMPRPKARTAPQVSG